MKTLEEYESELETDRSRLGTTGIQCPKCDGELINKDGSMMLSYPPQMNVECSKCDFKTTIRC